MSETCCRCHAKASGSRLSVSEPSKKRPSAPAVWPDSIVGYFCDSCWKLCVEYYNQFDALEDKP